MTSTTHKATHTPGPWIITNDTPRHTIRANGKELKGYCVANVDSLVDAKFIVRACNSHAAMLEALKGLDLTCQFDHLNPCTLSKVPGKHWGGADACQNCKAKAAIAQATQE